MQQQWSRLFFASLSWLRCGSFAGNWTTSCGAARGTSVAQVDTVAGIGSAPTAPYGGRTRRTAFVHQQRSARAADTTLRGGPVLPPSSIYCNGSVHCRQAGVPLPIPEIPPPGYPGAGLRRSTWGLLIAVTLPEWRHPQCGYAPRAAAGPSGLRCVARTRRLRGDPRAFPRCPETLGVFRHVTHAVSRRDHAWSPPTGFPTARAGWVIASAWVHRVGWEAAEGRHAASLIAKSYVSVKY